MIRGLAYISVPGGVLAVPVQKVTASDVVHSTARRELFAHDLSMSYLVSGRGRNKMAFFLFLSIDFKEEKSTLNAA